MVFCAGCRFDCGTGSALLISPEPVMMGKWNQLVLSRNENRGSLQLNGGDVVEGTAQVFRFVKCVLGSVVLPVCGYFSVKSFLYWKM